MRARNIKPGFFQNEDLAELPPETRLLFIGLWLMADREGRLEDRPRRIKMQIFPADAWDVEPMLVDLHDAGVIIRYEVDGAKYIEIPKFSQHQRPHPNEKPSVIPPFVATKGESASHQGSKRSVLNDESPNPESLNSLPPVEGAQKRATRLPADFEFTDERRLVAEAEKLPAERTFAKFRDYWLAASGQKARKHDWDATWRNWCRTEADRSRGPSAPNARKTKYEQVMEALGDDDCDDD